ncbi:hypothetical protein GGR56DRAFT_268597 [Xylariaceae sp. FL0804]|nr:hypothetical protein GGR56DRAFT_268597 [Xylariaceae sp. FL0804]
MDYLIYYISFLVLIAGTLLYLTRSSWLHLVPALPITLPRLPWSSSSSWRYAMLPSTSFAGDAEAGLSSDAFDLSGNIADASDARAGLDDAAKAEVLRIMKRRRLRFDEARRAYVEQRFRDNGIAADGRPRDPKFVSFS